MLPHYDVSVAVSEGNPVSPKLSVGSVERTLESLRHVVHGLADAALVSGGAYDWRAKDTHGRTQAQNMYELLLDYGLVPERAFMENYSRDTVGQALFTKILFAAPRNWGNLMVVTHHHFVYRQAKYFERLFGLEFRITWAGITYPSTEERAEDIRQKLDTFNATFAGVDAKDTEGLLRRLCERHPLYKDMNPDQILSLAPR